MRTGAALVMAAVAVSAATLTVHGAREAETRPRPELLPSELIWAIYSSCIYTGVPSPIFDAGIAMSVENHRMRVEVMDSAASPEEIASFEAAADDCLARYPVEDERLTRSGNSLGSDAERLLSYDVAQRWLLPCLEVTASSRIGFRRSATTSPTGPFPGMGTTRTSVSESTRSSRRAWPAAPATSPTTRERRPPIAAE